MHWFDKSTVGTLERRSNSFSCLIAVVSIALFGLKFAQAAYEVPNAAYAPPTTYYNPATGTGTTLQTSLQNIISANFTGRTYGDYRFSAAILDQDPNNPNNIILIYTNHATSVPATWDNGTTWNREHQFCVSWLGTGDPGNNDSPSIETDEFELRPTTNSLNSSRGNKFYASTTTSVSWYPTDADTGEIARTFFYLATRYYTGSTTLSRTNVQLINTTTSIGAGSFQGGDLASFLKWNYEYGVDNFERRRNQYIYGSSGDLTDQALNPIYYQGNRNPYIDHPEYVWAVFGTDKDGAGNIINNSQIYVGGSGPNSDGTSTANVNLGPVIVNSTLGTSSVPFNKTGADPTTFNISATGSAIITASSVGSFSKPVVGVGQGIDFGSQSGTVTVGLNASTSTAGLKTGMLTVHNSDLTTSGMGHGSADGDDTINVSASVLDHANASFSGGSDSNSLTINFGRIGQNTGAGGIHDIGFNLYNLEATVGFTAGLALNSISPSGNAGSLAEISTNLAAFANLAAGSHSAFDADINTNNLGTFSVTYTLGVSDQALPGATSNAPLTLTVTGTVNQYAPGDFNLDHHVDAADIAPMLQALTDPSGYESQYGVSPTLLSEIGDVNGDGSMNNADLQYLETSLIAGQGSNSAVPEPSTLVLLGLSSLILLRGRRREFRRR